MYCMFGSSGSAVASGSCIISVVCRNDYGCVMSLAILFRLLPPLYKPITVFAFVFVLVFVCAFVYNIFFFFLLSRIPPPHTFPLYNTFYYKTVSHSLLKHI